jgi:hypothetical protein
VKETASNVNVLDARRGATAEQAATRGNAWSGKAVTSARVRIVHVREC